jgi:hypothetical protein
MTFDAHRSVKDVSPGMVQPLMILPIQFFNAPDVSRPERELMMAVLADAVRCIEKYRSSDGTRNEQEYGEAQTWLLADEPNWPYSFEHICAVLRLDADAVRQRLRVLPSRASTPLKHRTRAANGLSPLL